MKVIRPATESIAERPVATGRAGERLRAWDAFAALDIAECAELTLAKHRVRARLIATAGGALPQTLALTMPSLEAGSVENTTL